MKQQQLPERRKTSIHVWIQNVGILAILVTVIIGFVHLSNYLGEIKGINDEKWHNQEIVNIKTENNQTQDKIMQNCLKSEVSSFVHSNVCEELSRK